MRESLEFWVAWRHLRSRENRRWTGPTGLLFAYVAAVGAGFMVWARARSGIAEEVASGPMAELFVPPIADIAGMIGLVTLAMGLLGLSFAVLARVFNLLSAIIILSVAQGCMALVVVLSLMTGLEEDLQAKIIKQKAEIRITQIHDDSFSGYAEIAEELRGLDEVAGASPYAQGEVMLRSPYNRQGALLVGIVPQAHAQVSNLEDQIDTGSYRFLTDPAGGPWEALDRLQSAREEEAKRAIEAQQAADPETAPEDQEDPDNPEDPDYPEDPDELDGDTWEDPAVEVPKLRGEPQDLPEAATGEGSGGASPEPEVEAEPENEVEAEPENENEAAADDDAWEDPSIEIPRLRAEGKLPVYAAMVPAQEPTSAALRQDSAEPTDAVIADPPTEGDPPAAAALVPLLIGAELSEELGVPLGGRIQLITPIGRMTPSGQIPSFLAVRVVGIFYSGMYAYDRQNVYAPLDRVQALLRLGDTAHGIEVKLVDSDRLDAATEAISARLAALGVTDLRVETWRSLNRNLFSAMFLEKIAMFIGLLFVVLVAAFGILATNLMSVLDKAQEIAILKAMGASDSRISHVFMIEGMIVGIVGSVAGIAAGLLFCSLLAEQGLPLPAENFYTQRLPVVVSPFEVLIVGIAALAIVWLSSVHPARTAARLRPIDGLRSSE